jgi:hypothetical protein
MTYLDFLSLDSAPIQHHAGVMSSLQTLNF